MTKSGVGRMAVQSAITIWMVVLLLHSFVRSFVWSALVCPSVPALLRLLLAALEMWVWHGVRSELLLRSSGIVWRESFDDYTQYPGLMCTV